jgi:putative peptidoglycan lipid II flippase
MLIGIVIGTIFTPHLIFLLVPGFSSESLGLTVYLTRIMFIQVFFMGLSGISMGILNSYKHFTAPAIGSVLYNLGIIVVGLILSPFIGIAGFSIGVVVGAALNFSVQLPILLKMGLRYKLSFNIKHPGVKKIFVLMFPVLIGLSVTHFNLFVNQNLASTLQPGIVAALRTGQRLMQLPIGVFAIAIAVAIFPTLTGNVAKGEFEKFKKNMSLGVRSVIFVTLPAAAGLIALRIPLIRLLFEQGMFTHENTLATAHALYYYSIGLFAYSAIQVLNRSFYALQNTITPVLTGVLTIAINIILNFALIEVLGHGGLALAYSIAGIFNMLVLLVVLRIKIGGIDGKKMLISFLQSFFSAFLMAAVLYKTIDYVEVWIDVSTKLGQFMQVILGIILGTVIYSTVVSLFKMEEAQMVLRILKRKFRIKERKKEMN